MTNLIVSVLLGLVILGTMVHVMVSRYNSNARNRYKLHMWKNGYMDAKYLYPEMTCNRMNDADYRKGADDGHRTMQLRDFDI